MRSVTIAKPDDWHVHFRDKESLQNTVNATAKHFARALVMPNIIPALTTVDSIVAYFQRIMQALDKKYSFTPYMTFYLNETINPDEFQQAKKHPYILGAKLYPAGATTNSDAGAKSIKQLYPLLDCMQQLDLVLQIHGEVTHGDIFSRESVFIREYLLPITRQFPKLRIVLEHISTRAAVEFVKSAPATVAATITPHHLLYNRNDLLVGGIKPHFYCLPILKRAVDQKAIQQAAISGNAKFFAGTDSAPHAQGNKESACGCAGIYSAPFAIQLYTQFFDSMGYMGKLEAFMSQFGAQFYRLPFSDNKLTLINSPQCIPNALPLGNNTVIPVAAGSNLTWSIQESD